MMRQACSGAVALGWTPSTKSTPGRAVQLADDDALGAVDDELAAADHDRHLAQVDRLLHDLVGVLAEQADADAERHAVGQPQLAALVRRVARLVQGVPVMISIGSFATYSCSCTMIFNGGDTRIHSRIVFENKCRYIFKCNTQRIRVER